MTGWYSCWFHWSSPLCSVNHSHVPYLLSGQASQEKPKQTSFFVVSVVYLLLFMHSCTLQVFFLRWLKVEQVVFVAQDRPRYGLQELKVLQMNWWFKRDKLLQLKYPAHFGHGCSCSVRARHTMTATQTSNQRILIASRWLAVSLGGTWFAIHVRFLWL